MNRKLKYIMFTIIGIIIGSTIGVIGSNVINANQVGYTSSKTTKTNMQDAIDELYDKASMIGFNTPKATGATIVKTNLPTGVKAIVYMDPTNLSKSCNASNSVSTTGTKTGCMKWYAFLEDSEYYVMILDHNTTASIQWNSSNSNIYPKTIQAELNKLVTDIKWKITPRLISATEILKITGNTTWTPSGDWWFYLDSNSTTQTAMSQGASKYAWLFDYTLNCTSYGCNTADGSTSGYFTSTAKSDDATSVYIIHLDGKLTLSLANFVWYGIRPVVIMSK